MTLHPPAFRGLSDPFLAALDDLTEAEDGGWWRDVLAHADLILAVRSESLNVYHRGASIFRVDFHNGRPVPVTHVKYLVRQRQTLITLGEDGAFGLPSHALWPAYVGPETLAEMIRAARTLVGPEKSGVHALVKASPNVVDVEIALEGEPRGGAQTEEAAAALDPTAFVEGDETPSPVGSGTKTLKAARPRQDRIDVASLEERGHPKKAWLVFHETKTYDNPDLRAGPKHRPKIANQIARYNSSIRGNVSDLRYSYPYVCQALVRLDAMRRRVRAGHPSWVDSVQAVLDPLIREVADGTRDLQIETEPRLVVFGFDIDQRDGALAVYQKRLQELGVRVYAIGKPQGVKQAAAFQRPKDLPVTTPAQLAAEAQAAAEAAVPPARSIPLPAGGPAEPCLYFGAQKGEVLPVYLCNPTPAPLTGTIVTCGSPTAADLSPLATAAVGEDGTLAPGTAVLIDRYGVMWDGDVLTLYEVAFTDAQGQQHRRRALIDKGGSAGNWLPLKALDPVS